MKKEFWKEFVALGLAGAICFSPTVISICTNSKFKDISEGYKVREIGNQRQFYIGTKMGLSRLAIDENKDGTLDKTLSNIPISAFMGGPGYRLMETETTTEDREKFERAKYLLSHAK